MHPFSFLSQYEELAGAGCLKGASEKTERRPTLWSGIYSDLTSRYIACAMRLIDILVSSIKLELPIGCTIRLSEDFTDVDVFTSHVVLLCH